MEASGKSLAEAKETVLDMLGVAEDDAEFVVLSEPKAGLFGRLRGEARVQARVRPVTPPPKRTRRPRPDKDRKREGGDRSRSKGTGQKNGAAAGRQEAGRSATDGAGRSADAPKAATSTNGNGKTAGAGRRSRPRSDQSKQTEEQASGRTSGDSEGSMEESLTLEQQGEAAQQFLGGLVREFGLDATVEFSEVDEDTVQVSATGDDLGLLVGPRGATLAAVQDLTRTFVQRQSENRTDRILVDVGGYREKRNAALRRFAEGIVEEVKSSGDERALEPMSPADRKVIHDTVNEIEGVETRSDGLEPSRYVVISPA
ncbi:MAG: RNA-binding cell elongation regulator Jag/EloR [Acidimicrobiales bacterium]